MRIVGVADVNSNLDHPTNNLLVSGDQFACITFLVSTDEIFNCDFLPIRWEWMDCGDNSITSPSLDSLYFSRNVFDFIGSDVINIPSGFRADLTNGSLPFPTTGGTPDSCLFPRGITGPKRYIDFKNGAVRVMCSSELDPRGDININGIANEIADLVQLKRYFIEGNAAFGTHVEGSTAAGDVNCDGIPLTVADLTYIQGIIIGRFLPCTQGTGILDSVTISLRNDIISTDRALGGALFVFEGRVTPTLLASNMEMSIGMVSGNTHVLVTAHLSQFSTEFIAPGSILQADGRLISTDVSDTLGASLNVQLDFATDVNEDNTNILPRSFALHQNYPNPFNPSTTIKIDFPRSSDYTITIYNIRGQKVNQQKGVHEAGELNYLWEPKDLPSGVYFYKVQAGDFVASRKLVLLK